MEYLVKVFYCCTIVVILEWKFVRIRMRMITRSRADSPARRNIFVQPRRRYFGEEGEVLWWWENTRRRSNCWNWSILQCKICWEHIIQVFDDDGSMVIYAFSKFEFQTDEEMGWVDLWDDSIKVYKTVITNLDACLSDGKGQLVRPFWCRTDFCLYTWSTVLSFTIGFIQWFRVWWKWTLQIFMRDVAGGREW